MTQHEAATRLEFSLSKVSRIESGQRPGLHEFRAMLDIYGLPSGDWEPYLDEYRRAKENGWWRAYGLSDQGYVSMEDEASRVREFQNGFIPGLLQTEAYAEAIFAASGMLRSRHTIENQIAVRMRRQDRLTTQPALRLDTIIDETVLRQRVPPQVMRAQLALIVERSNLPNVRVRVLPRDIEPHDGQYGAFILLDFPEPADPEIAYVEHAFGSVHIEEAEDVRAARLRFDQLAERALGETDSLRLLDRLASRT